MEKIDEKIKYIEDTKRELIEKYKNVIEKTFDITDKDLLQTDIDNEDEKQKEQRLLDALKKRRTALDEVDIILEKIEKLESSLDGFKEVEEVTTTKKSWVKKKASEINS